MFFATPQLDKTGSYFWQRVTLTPAQWALGCLSFYFLIILHLVIQNNGGTQGDELPWVWTCWIMLCFLLAGVWLLMPITTDLQGTATLKWLIVGCAVLTLPLLWSPHRDWQYHALPRLAGLWAGLIVYYSLLQSRITSQQWALIRLCIVVSAFIQSLFVLSEIFFPSLLPVVSQTAAKSFGYGVFQQKNVTASYLATGLALALGLLVETRTRGATSRTARLNLLFLSICLVIITALLYLLHSRIGWLGWCVDVICIFILFPVFNISPRRKGLIGALLIAGLLVGYGLSFYEPSQLKLPHDSSNTQRWLTIKACWNMFVESPLKGWGYGGFEYVFQNWVAQQHPPLDTREMMNHPHNEILFWLIEGGITSLFGLVIIGVAFIQLFWRRSSGTKCLTGMCMLPILLHTQVEYPLYLSATHWLILIILLAACDAENLTTQRTRPKHDCKSIRKLRSKLFVVLALGGAFISIQALKNEIVLTEFEMRTLADDESLLTLPLPWVMNERYLHDRALLNIIRFRNNHHREYLTDYIELSRRWSETRIDADVYNNLIDVQRYLHLTKEAEADTRKAQALFPYDQRF